MRTLLISIARDFRYSNAGIDQLASHLRKTHNVLLQYFHNGESMSEMEQILLSNWKQDAFHVVGFSVYSSNLEACAQLTHFLKSQEPCPVIFWGSGFISQFYREVRNDYPEVDYFILGDGEEPSNELLQALERGDHPHHRSILTQNGNIDVCTLYHNQPVLDLPAFDFYQQDFPGRNALKTHCLQTKSNICTGCCSFCRQMKGKVWYKSVEQLVREIRHVAEHYHVRKFFFTDDNLFDPSTDLVRDRIIELCNHIEKLPYSVILTCYGTACALTDSKEDHILLNAMSRAGFSSVFTGIETGNDTDLRLYRKKANLEDNYRIIRLLRRHNIVPIVGFIFFNPYSTPETIRQNFSYLRQIGSVNINNYINSFLEVYPGTQIYNQLKNDGLLLTEYSYKNTFCYRYAHQEASDIAAFVKKYLPLQNHDFSITISQLTLLYHDLSCIFQGIKVFEARLIQLQKKYLREFDRFFSILYHDQNLYEAKRQVDTFKAFLYEGQDELIALRRQLFAFVTGQIGTLPFSEEDVKGMYN